MYRRIAAGLCILAFAASCAANKDIKTPAETYYKQGEKLYTKKKYDQAAEKWRKVKEANTSPLLKTLVELKVADALFKDGSYLEAAAEYENFRKLHPKHSKAPYALFMLGLCNFHQVEKTDTDQTPAKNAVTVFETFLKEYPDTDLAKQAREKLNECKSKQASYEIYVGRYYYRTDRYGAAILRFKDALEKYPGAPVNDEALFLLGNSYLRTGEKEKALEALNRVVTDYPKSAFAAKAKDILKKKS
jgi:outer membrane protein assembly factor BamD